MLTRLVACCACRCRTLKNWTRHGHMRCTRTTHRALTRSISNHIHWRAWIEAWLHPRETGSTAASLRAQYIRIFSKHKHCTGEEVEAAAAAAAEAWVLRARLILVGAGSACGGGVCCRVFKSLALSEAPRTAQHGTRTSSLLSLHPDLAASLVHAAIPVSATRNRTAMTRPARQSLGWVVVAGGSKIV
jgi:hypothetical protein